MEGKVKWERNFGQLNKRMNFGEGSSPALYGDKIVVTWDHEGPSFIIALDKKTGKDVWKVDRDEATSWASPFVVESNGKPQVITSATSLIRSYDLATGDLIWECSGMTANAIPQPVEANGIVYIMTGFRGNALLAIRLSEAKGNITGTDAIIWSIRLHLWSLKIICIFSRAITESSPALTQKQERLSIAIRDSKAWEIFLHLLF